MTRVALIVVAALVLECVAGAQAVTYGGPSPFGFSALLDSSGQLPIAGNESFVLTLRNHPNPYGGGVIFGSVPNALPLGATTLLVDPPGSLVVPLQPGVTELPLAVPATPAIVGFSGVAQMGAIDLAIPGGFGLTNAISVTVMPDRTPVRAYIPGQDFSFGANAPGIMTVLDLSTQPPTFRATGSMGLNGVIYDNFSSKIAVAEWTQVAYALGSGPANQFVRAFDVAADPVGVVVHSQLGDIPIADPVLGITAARDMEVMSGGQYLFVTSGAAAHATLEVFDVSGAPFSLPSGAIQTIGYPNAGPGPVGLELSPQEDRLAVVIGMDSYPAIAIYGITVGASQPLTPLATVSLTAFSGFYSPSDVHFSPDGRLLLVSGVNGAYSVIDTFTSPPAVLVQNGVWPGGIGNLYCHGSAVAVQNGVPVGILASEGTPGVYYLIDLNTTSSTFGLIVGSFTTNPNGNVSNHRIHARQSIVVAIDGIGAINDTQWIDVIDLDQPVPGGYVSWRLKMPTYTTLTPAGMSCIPRDFDLY